MRAEDTPIISDAIALWACFGIFVFLLLFVLAAAGHEMWKNRQDRKRESAQWRMKKERLEAEKKFLESVAAMEDTERAWFKEKWYGISKDIDEARRLS